MWFLFRRKDLNRSLRDSVGRSPVHVAAQAGAVQCLKLLIEVHKSYYVKDIDLQKKVTIQKTVKQIKSSYDIIGCLI